MKKIEYSKAEEILTNQQPTLVKFGSPWCHACGAMQELIEEVEGNYSNVEFVEVDLADKEGVDLARKLRIMSIPVIMFIKDGKEVDRVIGAIPRSVLEEKLGNLK